MPRGKSLPRRWPMAANGSIPVEIKRLFEAYEIAMVPTFAAADAEQAVAHASALFAQGATVVLKIMSRDIAHKSDVGGVVLNLTTPMRCAPRRPISSRGRERCARKRGFPASWCRRWWCGRRRVN